MQNISKLLRKYYLMIVFNLSLYSLLGSLYFSEIQQLEPCTYCWWQRIFMYPLVLISAVGIYYKHTHSYRYILPLAIPGTLLALYQYVLQKFMPSGILATCSAGAKSCSTIDFELFGFITIPFLSFVAFAVILFVCIYKWYELRR